MDDEAFNSLCRTRDYPASRDRTLWCAVLGFAFEDLTTPDGRDPKAMGEAREWFESNSPDFQDVCAMANFDADAVRQKGISLVNV